MIFLLFELYSSAQVCDATVDAMKSKRQARKKLYINKFLLYTKCLNCMTHNKKSLHIFAGL